MSKKHTEKKVLSVVVHLCDFCGGWTVAEWTDPNQLIIAEQEHAAVSIAISDGEVVRFCENCFANALTRALLVYEFEGNDLTPGNIP